MPKVTIIQRALPHYRLPFFRKLFTKFNEYKIDFRLIYGLEYPGTVPKTVIAKDSWAEQVENQYFKFLGQVLVWQKIESRLLESDLLVVEQANRCLNNYSLQFFRKPSQKLAFWGHGRNMQTGENNFKEIIKKHLSTKVDWWFAYTDISRQRIAQNGFPEERITTVNNTIDTSQLQEDLARVSQQQIDNIFSNCKILAPQYNCLYVGGLYEDKNLDFLISSCEKVFQKLPGFSLIVVGSGPEENKMKEVAERKSWLKYVGPKFGTDLAPYYRCAKALLMPGLVGLVIIDSFIAGVPLFTTDNKIHSPEIAYLRHGHNGIITPNDEDSYSEAVFSYLKDYSPSLSLACLRSAAEYTLENMVTNFSSGIQQCLSAKQR
ncbi:glycosyltransferase family 4 protein [Thermodesulfobacteriota bacterium]